MQHRPLRFGLQLPNSDLLQLAPRPDGLRDRRVLHTLGQPLEGLDQSTLANSSQSLGEDNNGQGRSNLDSTIPANRALVAADPAVGSGLPIPVASSSASHNDANSQERGGPPGNPQAFRAFTRMETTRGTLEGAGVPAEVAQRLAESRQVETEGDTTRRVIAISKQAALHGIPDISQNVRFLSS